MRHLSKTVAAAIFVCALACPSFAGDMSTGGDMSVGRSGDMSTGGDMSAGRSGDMSTGGDSLLASILAYLDSFW